MPAAKHFQSIVNNFDSYATQLASLSQALSALREVADHIATAIAADRAEMAEYLVAQQDFVASEAAVVAAVTTIDAEVQTGSSDAPAVDVLDQSTSAAATSIEPKFDLDSEATVEPIFEPAAESAAPVALEQAPTLTADASLDGAEPTASLDIVALDSAADSAVLSAETDQAAPLAATADIADTAALDAAIATGDGKVVDLDSRRKQRTDKPARWRAKALVASLVLTATATLGINEIMQTELGQRLIELGTCDGDMLSANRDCALLAWLML